MQSEPMYKSRYFDPDFIDVVQLLDQYLKEKSNNSVIYAWTTIKKQNSIDDMKESIHTFSK